MVRPYLDKAIPEAWAAAQQYSAVVAKAASERGVSVPEVELIKVRASQINGCAYCLDLHSREARAAGVPQQRLDLLPAWRETSLYNEREAAQAGRAGGRRGRQVAPAFRGLRRRPRVSGLCPGRRGLCRRRVGGSHDQPLQPHLHPQ